MNTLLRRKSNPNPVAFSRHSLEIEKTPRLIKPSYSPRGICNLEFEAYIAFIEQILRTVLPPDLIVALSTCKDPQSIEKKILSLFESLPILAWNNPDRAPCTFCVSLVCHSEFTHGVGRYLCDTLIRWLVPGKFLNISCVRSLKFSFISCPEQNLFFHQVLQ